MKPIDFDQLRKQYRGTRYADFVAHHLKRQPQAERIAGVLETTQWLPAPLQPAMEHFIDRWNVQAYEQEFWNRDLAEVMDEIVEDARAFAQARGVDPDDDTLFNMFNIVTLSFAYSAYDQPKMRRFMGI